MKVKFSCSVGWIANSDCEETFDVESDLGYTPETWKSLTEEQQWAQARDWAFDRGIDIVVEEVED